MFTLFNGLQSFKSILATGVAQCSISLHRKLSKKEIKKRLKNVADLSPETCIYMLKYAFSLKQKSLIFNVIH
jgi:hypothetical protein